MENIYIPVTHTKDIQHSWPSAWTLTMEHL